METIWVLAYMVQYGALVVAVGSAGALVLATVSELVRNKATKSGVLTSVQMQKPIESQAL